VQAAGLTHKYQTRLERTARDEHFSVIRKFVNGDKNFLRTDSLGK
jgi:hypothetical protein